MQARSEATLLIAEEPAPEPAGSSRPRVRFTSNIAGPIFLVTDILCILLSGPLALLGYFVLKGDRLVPSVNFFAFAAAAGAYLLIRASRQAYRRTLVNLFDHEADAVIDALSSVLIASALVWQFGMIANLSRGITLLYLASFTVCLTLSRPLIRQIVGHLAKSGAIEQRIVFYGADRDSIAMIRQMLAGLDLPHLRVVGVADDRPKVKQIDGLAMIGGLDEVLALARRGELDQVLFCVPDMPPARLNEILDQLSTVSVGHIPVLTLWQRPFRDINQFIKRGEDLLIAGTALVILSPVVLLTALLVRLSSPGPLFFVQPRIGFNNEVIRVFKFRTMYTDRSDLRAEQTTTANDPRVTPIGRWLRKLSLDELPQLFNVVRGDMSLVGPRPHATHMKVGDRYYQDTVRGYAGRHRVKPGITGLAQVKGVRGEIRTIERAKLRVELDTQYIDNWSVWLDLWILLATVRAVIWDGDAY
jgi:polysaccharide biosynthesis protein PslA